MAAPSSPAVEELAQDATAETHRATAVKFLRALHDPGDVFETRLLHCPGWIKNGKPGKLGTWSGHYRDPEQAAADVVKVDASHKPVGCYVTANPTSPDLLARGPLGSGPKDVTTQDDGIARRRWLPVDLDPERQKGIAATDAERTAALDLAARVVAEMAAAGWPAPIRVGSGNGALLLWRVELPNDADALDLITRVLAGMGARFDTPDVHVDKAMCNAARIIRLPGTWNRKGTDFKGADNIPARPWRIAELLDVPSDLVPVSRELLEAVASPKPAAIPARATTPPRAPQGALHASVNAGTTFDRFDPTPDGVRSYLERHGVPVSRLRADGEGTMLDLRECPIAGSAGGTSVSVRVGAGGLVTYHNLHNGGSGLTWADVRDHLEPGHRAHSERMKGRGDTGHPFDPLPGAGNTPASGTAAPGAIGEPQPWEPPIPLDGAVVLPEFPLDALPVHVAGFVRELAASLEVHPDMPAALALLAGAAASQGKYIVRVKPDYFEPVNIFGAVAADPGQRKSATIREVMAPLHEYERELQARERDNVKLAENEFHVDAERRKVLLKKSASAKVWEDREAAKRELDELPPAAADPPSLPRLTAGADILPEVLAKLLNQHNGRLTIVDAEGGTLFGNFGGRYSSGNPNFEILLKAHAGDPVKIDRQGRPPIFVKDPCLTVILAIQEDVVTRLADVPQFHARGLDARFNFSFIPHPPGGCTLDGPPVSDAARNLYRLGIRAALDLPHPPDGRAHELTFTGDALEVYRPVAVAGFAEMRDGGATHGLQGWAGKAHGLAARVAGVLHVLEHSAHGGGFVDIVDIVPRGLELKKKTLSSSFSSCYCGGFPEAEPISADTVINAWKIVTYWKAHALHAASLMGADPETDLAKRILAWARQTGKTSFSQRDCHMRFKSSVKKSAELEGPLSVLVDRGYLKRETPPREEGKPGRPKAIFKMNPIEQNPQNPQNRLEAKS